MHNTAQIADEPGTGWPEGEAQLEKVFQGRSRQHWCDLLEGSDACFAPVLNMSEAVEHPHNVARGTFIDIDIDGVVQPAPAPKFSVSNPVPGKFSATGQHTQEVLENMGYDGKSLERLTGQTAIQQG